jgi:hypothetical protein
MIASAWIEIVTVKILFREIRTRLFTLGLREIADVSGLRQGMILFSYGTDPCECPRASQALGFLTASADAEHGVFSRHGGLTCW